MASNTPDDETRGQTPLQSTPESTAKTDTEPAAKPRLLMRVELSIQARRNHPRVSPADLPNDLRQTIKAVSSAFGKWPFYLWSPKSGSGKTTVSLMVLDRAGTVHTERSYTPADAMDVMSGFIDYRNFPPFLDGVRRKECSWSIPGHGSTLNESDVWDFIGGSPLIVVDDVCDLPYESVKFGQDHRGNLKKILDVRGVKPTFITGNLDPYARNGQMPELARVMDKTTSDRITDRITCGTIFEMKGESLRGKQPVHVQPDSKPKGSGLAYLDDRTPEEKAKVAKLFKELRGRFGMPPRE